MKLAGKSLLAYHIISNAQKMGGFAAYIDVERALNQAFVERMGVNWSKLYRPKKIPSTVEETFELIEQIIKLSQTYITDKSKPVVVIVDSIAALVGKEEVETGYDESVGMGLEARAMSRCLRKIMPIFETGNVTLICINQLRQKINAAPFQEQDVTAHGKALGFYASVRIKLQSVGQIKVDDEVIGIKTKATVFKNKVGPARRAVEFPLYYDWGINNEISIYDYLVDVEEIKGTTWKTWTVNGKEHKWQGTAYFVELMKDKTVREYVMDLLEKKMVRVFDERPEDIEVQINPESLLEVEQLSDDIKERQKKGLTS
jgi:recombination protein RecA